MKATQAITLTNRVLKAVQAGSHRDLACTITQGELQVLCTVYTLTEDSFCSVLTPKGLSHYTGSTPMSVSNTLNSLVEKGLVERVKDDLDRRQKIVRLTNYGYCMAKYVDDIASILLKGTTFEGVV